jgi:hypothetical protein
MQFNACTELKNKLIIAVKIRRKRRNENIDVNCLMKKSTKQLKINYFLADAFYDSEKNHQLAGKYKSKLIASLRKNGKVPIRRTKGIHRKRLRKDFPREIYKKRVIIEGIFSSMKRKYAEVVYAKKFVSQKKELLFRALTYNLNFSNRELYFLQNLYLEYYTKIYFSK